MTGDERPAPDTPLMYGEIAAWWPLLSPPADYAEEAAIYTDLLKRACRGEARTLLELGSGGGNNASHMKRAFEITLVEPAPGMLEVSRRLNPELEHHQGDMRTVRLGRTFDCVFIHDAICYMTTETDLRAAIETARVHCRPGGGILLAPDAVTENFAATAELGGSDDGAAGIRFIEWSREPEPGATTFFVDYVHVLRGADGNVRTLHDRHVQGLFPRATWLRLMDEAGIDAHRTTVEHSELEPGSYEVFVGTLRG